MAGEWRDGHAQGVPRPRSAGRAGAQGGTLYPTTSTPTWTRRRTVLPIRDLRLGFGDILPQIRHSDINTKARYTCPVRDSLHDTTEQFPNSFAPDILQTSSCSLHCSPQYKGPGQLSCVFCQPTVTRHYHLHSIDLFSKKEELASSIRLQMNVTKNGLTKANSSNMQQIAC